MIENFEGEIWKPVVGYEGYYEVSNMGRIKSLGKWVLRNGDYKKIFYKPKILKTTIDKRGYVYTTLSKNKKQTSFGVHRLVASAFLSNPINLPCVNHKDENPSNNCVGNLEWCTAKYNTNYGSGIERRVRSTDYTAAGAKRSKVVLQFDDNMILQKRWLSARVAGKELGINETHIRNVCYGLRHTYRGYIWKLEEPKHEYRYQRS